MTTAAIAVALVLGTVGPIQYPYQDGVATYYTYQDYGKGPLYAHPFATYDPYNQSPWCAVNVQAYLDGSVQAGDMLLVEFIEYDIVLFFEAWDAGPFDGYYVEDFAHLPIIVDIPKHLWPLDAMSAQVQVTNLSGLMREHKRYVN